MAIFSVEEVKSRQTELVDLGYTIVPDVMPKALLEEVRTWSDGVFDRVPVNPKYRYQGSDIHVWTPRRWAELDHEESERFLVDPLVERIIDEPKQQQVCQELQLEGLQAHDNIILLSKPAFGPPLYWHQDYMNWNSPAAATPWPQQIFLSYYMTDTNRENGCLRVIPGTHRQRIDLHEVLPNAHGPEIQAIEDMDHPVFMDHPDAIDVPMAAGDLIVADARLLHGAWPNKTGQRRTLVLAWHSVFPFPKPPSWWEGEVPEVVRGADLSVEYGGTRTPSDYLR